MKRNYHKVHKFGNQISYYSHVTGQIFTHAVLSTFDESIVKNLGTLEKFDSLLEARVYSMLKTFQDVTNSSKTNIKVFITRQVPITVKPATLMFSEVVYKADFQLDLVDTTDRISPLTSFIEAKGIETPEYRLKMKFLEYYNPEIFMAILQVTDGRKPESITPSISVKELPEFCIKFVEMYFNLRAVAPGSFSDIEEAIAGIMATIVKTDNN